MTKVLIYLESAYEYNKQDSTHLPHIGLHFKNQDVKEELIDQLHEVKRLESRCRQVLERNKMKSLLENVEYATRDQGQPIIHREVLVSENVLSCN